MYQATVGISRHNISREAGMQAVHQAMAQMPDNIYPVFGLVIFDNIYQADEILKGISSLLANVPYIGLSSNGVLTHEGYHNHAVAVALFYADNVQAASHWYDIYAQSGVDTARWLKAQIRNNAEINTLLCFADAFNGDAEQFLNNFESPAPLLGALAAGQIQRGRNYQLSDKQSGMGALAALSLSGHLPIGYGYGHGWRPSGVLFRITRSRGQWIRTLDGQPASDAYAKWFQFPTKDWSMPPLVSNVRIYPLGLVRPTGENDAKDEMRIQIRAPLRVEIDGSFRMNAIVRDGQDAHLMIGSREHCLQAARNAANSAILQIGKYRPTLALALIDTSWQMLMADAVGEEINTLLSVIGEDIPVIGGYTLGQLAPDNENAHSTLLNNHILLIIFGSDEEAAPVLPDIKDVYLPPEK